jgi:ABC-2 type transport system ATP-binding protein
VCDHLVLLSASRVQLCGDTDDLLASHKLLVGPRKDTSALERMHTVVHAVRTPRQASLLVRLGGSLLDPGYEVSDVSLEELVLGYMGAAAPAAYAHLTAVGEDK